MATLIEGCEWNKNIETGQCGPTSKLYLASNMKRYCLIHYRIVEYVLVTNNIPSGNKENKKHLSKSDSGITNNSPTFFNKRTNHSLTDSDGSSNSNNSSTGASGRSSPLTSLVMEKICHAKGCDSKNVKVVCQGMFCNEHEKIIKYYRCIIEQNKRDEYELYIREMEQNLRKVPHPLFQKQIDILNSEVRKKEAEYINFIFTMLPYQ